MENPNNVSACWYDEWGLDTWLDSPIIRWLGETFLSMLIKEPAENPKPDKDDPFREALLPEQK
jgi:hypothetical protein